MRIKLNESEKNRIKSLHKNYSIIKEQDNCPPSDTTSPFYTNPGEFCINCGPGAYYFNHNDCPCCDGDNQVGMEPCKDPNSPFNTNLPEFCYVQNGVYHHQQPGASYHNHPDADCCGPIVDDDGDVLDLDDESYENEVGVSMIGSGSGFKDKQGNSDRLEKFNRNNIDLKAKPSSGGNFRMGESDLKRIVKRVINERNANRGIVGENWKDTSWEDDDGKITIGDITDYIGNNIRNISVSDLENKLGDQVSSVTQGEERIMKADLQYPIILVQKDGEFSYVLDGNHRLAKAIMTGEEYIKAKVLYLDDKNTPEDFKRLLGRE